MGRKDALDERLKASSVKHPVYKAESGIKLVVQSKPDTVYLPHRRQQVKGTKENAGGERNRV